MQTRTGTCSPAIPGKDRETAPLPAKGATTPGPLSVVKWHGPLAPVSAGEARGVVSDAADVCLDWYTSMMSDGMAPGKWDSGVTKQGSSDVLGTVDVAESAVDRRNSHGTALLPAHTHDIALLVGAFLLKHVHRVGIMWGCDGAKVRKIRKLKFERTPTTCPSVQVGVTQVRSASDHVI